MELRSHTKNVIHMNDKSRLNLHASGFILAFLSAASFAQQPGREIVGQLVPFSSKSGASYQLITKSGERIRLAGSQSFWDSHNGVSSLEFTWVKAVGPIKSGLMSLTQLDRIPSGDESRRLPSLIAGQLPRNFAASSQSRPRTVQLGNIQVLNLLVRFADSTTITPLSVGYFEALFGTQWPGLQHYFKEVSYGKMSISPSILGWVNLPKASSYYHDGITAGAPSWNADKILDDLMPQIEAKMDPSTIGMINVIPNITDNNGHSWATKYHYLRNGKDFWIRTTVDNPPQLNAVFVHEMGHEFGFDHTSGHYDNPYDSLWDPMGNGGGWFNTVGILGYQKIGDHYNAFHKYHAGWIDKSQVFFAYPGTSQQIRLERTALPSAQGYLMAKIYLGSGRHYVTAEARRFAGYDDPKSLPGECVLLHDVQEGRQVPDPYVAGQIDTDRASEVIDATLNADPNDAGAQWTVGKTYKDSANGMSIHVDSKDATGFLVTIKVSTGLPRPDVVRNTNDSGPGSLRDAMRYAEECPGAIIRFRIPKTDPGFDGKAFTIKTKGFLSDIISPGTILDATTQNAFTGNTNGSGPVVYLDGSSAGDYVSGFVIKAPNCVVSGFGIINFKGAGVNVSGADNASVQRCWIGLAAGGLTAAANGWDGINSENHSAHGRFLNNVLCANANGGIQIHGGVGATIQGNYVGVAPDGKTGIGNGWAGIWLGEGSSNCLVGGVGALGNLVGSNKAAGISLDKSSSNSIIGNRVGVNLAVTSPLGNQGNGVEVVDGSTNNQIGSKVTGGGNWVAGNNSGEIMVVDPGTDGNSIFGNRIGVSSSLKSAIGNPGNGIYIGRGARANKVGDGTPGSGNLIGGSGYAGIAIADPGTTGNIVQSNVIGCDPTGAVAIPNKHSGIAIFNGASSNTIGGIGTQFRNLCSGNGDNGIQVGDPTSTGNLIYGNWVGLNATGKAVLPNAATGIAIYNSAGHTIIGTTLAGGGNVCCGNGSDGIGAYKAPYTTIKGNRSGVSPSGTGLGNHGSGISVASGSTVVAVSNNWSAGNGASGIWVGNAGTSGVVIKGNTVGCNLAGSVAIPNTYAGITLDDGASSCTIGGTAAGERNLVSGGADLGILLSGSATTANFVLSNFVGVDASGKLPLANQKSGIGLWNGAHGNTLAYNVVSGNGNSGFEIYNQATLGNKIISNRIGVNVAGNSLPNAAQAIDIGDSAHDNTIGTITAGNVVDGDPTHDSIRVWGDNSLHNSIRGNNFLGSSELNINLQGGSEDVYGVTANHMGGDVVGPNNLQNYPEILSRSSTSSIDKVTYQLSGLPSTTYSIDVYITSYFGGSYHGGKMKYLTTAFIKTLASGMGTATVSIPKQTMGTYVLLQATSPTGNSSEFGTEQ